MVAPNGARLQKADHPSLPITLAETVETAVACAAVGADGLHLHLRDENGRHILNVGLYRNALGELRHVLPGFPVQITTEAVGIYDATFQREVALNSGAEMVSVAVRELMRDGSEMFGAFQIECRERGIAVQHILFDLADCELLAAHLPSDLFHDRSMQLIFVLGRYSDAGASGAGELDPFLNWLSQVGISPDWSACAFGKAEAAVLSYAVQRGGKCRIGFENSLYLPNGELAKDNAEKISAFLAERSEIERE